MCCLLSSANCAPKSDLRTPLSPATTQCTVECVPVSKAFIKEHAELFDEVIRLRAALQRAHDTHP